MWTSGGMKQGNCWVQFEMAEEKEVWGLERGKWKYGLQVVDEAKEVKAVS